jgi:hypothetical protein
LGDDEEDVLEQVAEGDDKLFVAQLTGVALVFISDYGFGQVPRSSILSYI